MHVLRVPTPYRLLSMPSFDFDAQQTFGNGAGQRSSRYDVRAAGDFAHGRSRRLIFSSLYCFPGSLGNDRSETPTFIGKLRSSAKSPPGGNQR